MPVVYDLNPESGLIHTRCVGELQFEEVLRHFEELENDPSLPARLDVLLDLDEAESVPETEELQAVVGRMAALESKVKWGACAIVATRDVLFGMSRMFQVLSEGRFVTSRVFRDRQEAEAWLASVRSAIGS